MKLLCHIMMLNNWDFCWWNDKVYSNIIDRANKLGMVYRQSTTQVHWTEKGQFFFKKYAV